MQSAYYFANCNGGNALGQYGACGLRHLRAILPPVFHSGGIDMGDFPGLGHKLIKGIPKRLIV